MMKNILLLIFLPVSGLIVNPVQEAGEETVLRKLLDEFLVGASANDYTMHNRFWSDDLIYTSAGGERITKTDILSAVPADENEEALPVYSSEDVQINLYGETAVVAFRLVAQVPLEEGGFEIMNFYNTGTFVKDEGRWRAVAWQATRVQE